MPLHISSINSGSNGNCYYVGNANEAVLIDAGISCRETERRMEAQQLDIGKVKAIFISHEHSDHIHGVNVLSKKFRLPVYITAKTQRHSGLKIAPDLVQRFTEEQPIRIGDLNVFAFSKFHDATDPYSFVIQHQQTHVGVFTDIGHVCKKLIRYFKLCNAAFLESNYDEHMLATGGYPPHLQKRIRGKTGHLSNDQALELFLKHRSAELQLILLSHLSENNNHPDIALKLFQKHSGKVDVQIASRYEASKVFKIAGNSKSSKKVLMPGRQLELFY
jgi:phosphoribosyl 1,2-cyclic phosphodiesterase